MTASDAGTYSVSCTGAESDVFGVGGDASAGEFFAVFDILAGGVVSMIGFITLMVTAVRRGSHNGLARRR